MIADLPGSAGESIAAELGERCAFAPTDVTSEADVQAALSQFTDVPLRTVVNCAGIAPPKRIIGRNGPHDLDQFRKVIEVNLIGTFNVLRLAADSMRTHELVDGERGVIVMTASIAAFDGQIGQAAYSSSKAGVHGLTLTAARDLAEHAIRVCSVAPGIFETPMLLGLPPAARRHWEPGSSPQPPRKTGRIRSVGRAHRREPHAERRNDPPRRSHPHATQVTIDGALQRHISRRTTPVARKLATG